jgi:YYY domain-containing protein
MIQVAAWWFCAELLGIIALPITFSLFKNLPDRGYAFSKVLGILIPSYLVWLVVSLGALPNSRWTIAIILFILTLGSLFLFRHHRNQITHFLSQGGKDILIVELLFLLSFFLLALVRAYSPEIYGTEKPMDFAFLNAILRSEHFPPPDPWLSGHFLNNYYFGHLIVAMLTKLIGTSPAVSFNLALALTFALATIGTFSLIFNLVRMAEGGNKSRAAVSFGLIGCILLLIMGNLEGILEFFCARGFGGGAFWNWVGIKGLVPSGYGAHWLPQGHWWWWRSTRVIDTVSDGASLDYTITEYPYFSFLLGDLHAHVMSLPFVLLCLTISLNLLASRKPLGLTWLKENPLQFVVIVISLGALGAIHSWDFPIYTFIFVAAILMQVHLGRGGTSSQQWRDWGVLAGIGVVSIFAFYLPFYLHFQSPIWGIFPWRGPDTRPIHYFIVLGLFLFISLSFILSQTSSLKSVSLYEVMGAVLIILLPLGLWSVCELTIGAVITDIGGSLASVGQKFWHLLPLLVVLAFTLSIIVVKTRKANMGDRSPLFVLLLAFTGLFLAMGCELFYVRDAMGNRMNTVFRLYYQSWVLLAVASTFGLYYLHRRWKVMRLFQRLARFTWRGALILLLLGCFILPVGATWNRSNGFAAEPTLDGMEFLRCSKPSEWEAINWLNLNIKGSPVIVEAAGKEYTESGRVSVYTGLPTILGWEGHELVWRGSSHDLQGRAGDIDLIYSSKNLEQVNTLLQKYGVMYVYVGHIERSKYGSQALKKFATSMDTVFKNQGVAIYKVKGG